jgi:hypothetical protein
MKPAPPNTIAEAAGAERSFDHWGTDGLLMGDTVVTIELHAA